jgi:hypothetical protein
MELCAETAVPKLSSPTTTARRVTVWRSARDELLALTNEDQYQCVCAVLAEIAVAVRPLCDSGYPVARIHELVASVVSTEGSTERDAVRPDELLKCRVLVPILDVDLTLCFAVDEKRHELFLFCVIAGCPRKSLLREIELEFRIDFTLRWWSLLMKGQE